VLSAPNLRLEVAARGGSLPPHPSCNKIPDGQTPGEAERCNRKVEQWLTEKDSKRFAVLFSELGECERYYVRKSDHER
jgi:hypothetical protein